jgi:peptidylprolyl isomerase
MRSTPLLAAALLAVPAVLWGAEAPPKALAPGEIVAAAPAGEWVAITPADLLVMTLAPDAKGRARRVVIQLMPAPFSQGWIGNIRKLAAAHWWDGLAVTRVQDNYVAQWGDPDGEDSAKAKPLPAGLSKVPESAYELPISPEVQAHFRQKLKREEAELRAAFATPGGAARIRAVSRAIPRDPYSDETDVFRGWPIGRDQERFWPVHCYAMVGVGRNLSPDTGTGAELYTVIGHAPRHLDRNIALVGRVIEGIEHLSSLPRGTGALGVYETAAERTPIVSIRLASDLPEAERPKFEYLSTEGPSFARYVAARANRRDEFFIRPAGGVDVCNVPVPVRRVK